MDIILLLIGTFFFWLFIKLADAHDEHGMKSFRWAWMLFGILWWLFWAYIVSFSSDLHALYLSIIFYWLYKFKIDYPNHAIGTIIMLFGAFMFQWEFLWIPTALLLLSYILWDFIKVRNKFVWKNSIITKIFRLKPQFIVWPVLFSILTWDLLILSYYIILLVRSLAIKVFKIDQKKWENTDQPSYAG